MRKFLVVAKWEYLERVKSKSFLIGLFLTPLIMVAMGVLPGLLAGKEDEATKVIGVIDATGEISTPLAERMARYTLSNDQPNYLLQPIAVGKNVIVAEASREADKLVADGDLSGYVVIASGVLTDSVRNMEYRSKGGVDFRLVNRLESQLNDILVQRRLAARGIDSTIQKSLMARFEVKPVKITKEGEKEETSVLKTFFSAYILVMALFFLIFTSGQLLVRGVLEEKSNRIIEILVSSCTPSDLMIGKVLGLSALGLTQVAFWSLIGLGITSKVGSLEMPSLDVILLLLAFFAVGYLFYCSVFIAFGTPVTTEQEAQQVNGYLVMFLVMPIALVLPVMQHPNALWVKVLTFIPLLTPTFMALRLPVEMPAMWEIGLSLGILIISTYFMMVAAGRIFRIAILSTGKKPSLMEIFRWVLTG